MSQAMTTGSGNHEGLQEKQFRKQLVATVSKTQWSYAIFWTTSTRQQNVLAWNNGYYNGDIKTRKTTQPMEYKDDQIGLERSEQLRELYESLSAGDGNQQNKRSNASLSPEDLTDEEWYYLVCMSFTFNPGQCLPGKAFANNQHIWLSNVQFADHKVFSRSLLAKSASIQTVVCFPFMGGVLELGSTEQVLEDSILIQQITTSLFDLPNSVQPDNSKSSSSSAKDGEIICSSLGDNISGTIVLENHNLMADCRTPAENAYAVFPFVLESDAPNSIIEVEKIVGSVDGLHGICEDLILGSPDVSSNDCCTNQYNVDSFLTEGLNSTSQVHGRQLLDEDLSNGVYGSFNSNDYTSMSFVNEKGILSSPNERLKNNMIDIFQDWNYSKLISVDLDSDGTPYTQTIANILGNTKQVQAMQCFGISSPKSCFTVWTRASTVPKPLISVPQQLLKKILLNPALEHGGQHLKAREENEKHEKASKREGDAVYASHVMSERRRRGKLNEKFVALRSIIPSLSKVDKASILGDTIDYLKELERRVAELESFGQLDENGRGRRKQHDIAERTSDNYGNEGVKDVRRSLRNKRKADDNDESVAEHHWVLTKDGPSDVNVTIIDKEVLIEMNCPWRDCLMLEIVKSICNLQLDPLSVQTSTVDGILSLIVKSKFKNSVITSPGMIKRSLKRVVSKC